MDSSTTAPTMIKFPSIDSFQKFSKHMRRNHITTVEAVGSVKLHGTHVDVVGFFESGTLQSVQYQSRNLVLDKSNKMLGVFGFLETRKPVLEELLKQAHTAIYVQDKEAPPVSEPNEFILLAGEFVGENIQPNVALQQLSKRFVIYNVLSNHGWWTAPPPVQAEIRAPDSLIFHIAQAPLFHVTINLQTGDGTEKLEQLVQQIEAECPFAAMFGVSGLGEGAVFKAKGYEHDPLAWFKVKGQQHQPSAIVKPLKPKVSEEVATMYANAEAFAEALVAPRRLEQGIEYLVENGMDTKSMSSFPAFARWVQEDVLKEESEEIKESGLDWALLRKKIVSRTREFYQSRLQ